MTGVQTCALPIFIFYVKLPLGLRVFLFCEDIATNFRIVYTIFVLKIAAILCITAILSIMSLMEYSIEYAINDNR